MPTAPTLFHPCRAPRLVPLALATAGIITTLAGGCARPTDTPPYREPPPGFDARPEAEEPLLTQPGDAPEGPISPSGAELPSGDPGAAARPMDEVILASDQSTGSEVEPVSGGYRTVGGVLGEVNGRAIFTDEVIAKRRNELRALARRLPPGQFQREAARVVQDELGARMRDRLQLAVFERYTRSAEQETARSMTAMWRMRYITDSGGSEATARQRAREEGMTLEQLAEEKYKRHLGQIFMQKRILPQVRPAAEDVRAEYRKRLATGALQQQGEIEFSLIEIRPESNDPTALAEAQVRARGVLERARAGEDFAELARAESDDESYAERGGRLPASLLPLQKGSYRIAKVEDAAWATPEGEIAPLIEVGTGSDRRFYIVRVDHKVEPRTLSFDEVQATLLAELAQARQEELMMKYIVEEQERLDLPSVEQQNKMLNTALEVVFQNYEAWRDGDAR